MRAIPSAVTTSASSNPARPNFFEKLPKPPASHRLIFEWTMRYVRERYADDGLVDIQGPTETLYYLGEGAAARHAPRSPSYLLVLKRKA
jgi:hypothetical protein